MKPSRETIRKALPKHGLAGQQALPPHGGGKAHVRTTLPHKSGQWIAGECVRPCRKHGGLPGMGNALTYARRYSLSAIVRGASEVDGETPRPRPTARTRRAKTSASTEDCHRGPKPETIHRAGLRPARHSQGRPQAAQKDAGGVRPCPAAGLEPAQGQPRFRPSAACPRRSA